MGEGPNSVQNRSQRRTDSGNTNIYQQIRIFLPQEGKSLTLMNFLQYAFIYQTHTMGLPVPSTVWVAGDATEQTRQGPTLSDLMAWRDCSALEFWMRKEGWNWKDEGMIISQRQIIPAPNAFLISLVHAISHVPPKSLTRTATPVYTFASRTQRAPHIQVNTWYFPTSQVLTAILASFAYLWLLMRLSISP